MWPRVCGHGLAFARNTALPDLAAYGDARRTGPRLRRAAEPAPAQRCEPGMPTSDTHRPPLRSSHAAVWAPSEGCESVAVCRRVEFAPDVQKRQGLAIPRPKAVLSSRAPHAYTCTYTRTCTHVYACIRMHAHSHSCTCACTHSCAHSCTRARTQDSAHAHTRDYTSTAYAHAQAHTLEKVLAALAYDGTQTRTRMRRPRRSRSRRGLKQRSSLSSVRCTTMARALMARAL